jgi:hypothetical protein
MKTSIFYNDIPDAHDGPGYYLHINSIARDFGPYETYKDAVEAEEYYIENFLDNYPFEGD